MTCELGDGAELLSLHISQALRDLDLRFRFGKTSQCQRYEMRVRLRSLLMAFGNVRRDRNSSSTQLRAEPVHFLARRYFGQTINCDDEANRNLTCFQIPVGLNSH